MTAVAPSTTLTVRAFGRKTGFWVVAGIVAIVIAIVAALIAGGSGATGVPLGATNPAPAGSKALVEVLRNQGVTVTVVDTLEQATDAVSSGTSGTDTSTIFFSDPNAYLTAEQLRELGTLAPRLVIAAPGFLTLETLASGVGFGGVSDADTLAAECDVPAAKRADTITPGGNTLSLAGIEAPDPADGFDAFSGCFPSSADRYSVVQGQVTPGSLAGDGTAAAQHTVTLVATTDIFDNEHIVEYGNAALALGLLGESDSLVWYLPTQADVPVTGPPSLGELTPGWVTPVLLLLVATAIAAFIWRGRRFGALVAENLPVIVTASETMEGRARLYARNSARLRAADSLRVGTVRRLVSLVGLPRSATLDDVIRAVAAITGRAPADVGAILVGAAPGSDRSLVTLSDQLEELERLTRRLTDPNQAAGPNQALGPNQASGTP